MRPLRASERARRVVGAATVVVLATSLMAVGGATTASAERSDRAPDKTAGAPLLDRPGRGPEVLRRLADGELAEAGLRNGRSTEALREILEDPTAGLSTSGRVFYAEPAPEKREAATRTDAGTSARTAAAPYPLEDTFFLHSRPGSKRTLYIDVDGHHISGALWNRDGWPSTFYPGFVGSHETASESQRRTVQEVWQRVAEDYAPFDVNVTTEDPGAAALERTSTADTTYGMRALVVDSRKSAVVRRAVDSDPCYGCVGIAYMGTWGHPSGSFLQPVLAFSDRVEDAPGQDNPWQIAETITHEVGHSFDLEHDGIWRGGWIDPYYTGHGAWSPIMGAGSTGLTQWSRGEYTGATQTQDDLAIIARGAPRIPDDHGDTPATASTLEFPTEGPGRVEGLITTAGDHDVFAVTRACTGPLAMTVTPTAAGANLDVALRVIGPDGSIVVPRTNPTTNGSVWSPTATNLGATASVPSPAPGTHYIEVTGGDQGGPTNGWTAYGSLGRYTLTVDACVDEPGTELEPGEPPVVAHEQKLTFPRVTQPTPGRPAPLRVKRGKVGAPRTLIVHWGTAEDRGTPVTGYVVSARQVRNGTVVKTARRTLGPGKRRSVWRLKPGRYRFMVSATSLAGPGLRTKWSLAKRPR